MSEHIQQIMSISTENLSVSVPTVQAFFDEQSNTFSYVVSDPVTGQCAIIDSVLNYEEPPQLWQIILLPILNKSIYRLNGF